MAPSSTLPTSADPHSRCEGAERLTASAMDGGGAGDGAPAISGQDLSNFFQVWLYTPQKPTTW
jgi:hypothetical protein